MKQKDLSALQAGLTPIVVVVLIGILVVGGYLIYKLPRTSVAPLTPQATTSPTGSVTMADLPPLYPGLEWVSAQTMPLVFRTTMGKDIILQNAYHIESIPIKEKPEDFLQFYQKKLAAMGWQKTDSGSIAGEEWYRYEKNGRYFNFGYYTALGDGTDNVVPGFRALVEHN